MSRIPCPTGQQRRTRATRGLIGAQCLRISPRRVLRVERPEVARLLEAARAAAPNTEMWGGLMGYAGQTATLRDQVRAARDAGCEGAILFAYDPAQRDLLDVFATA